MSHTNARVRTAARVVATVTALALTVAGLSACGSTRSTEAFCSELHSGNDTMKAAYHSAGQSMGSQFGMILANLSECSRMIHQLDDVAPEEIRTDMDQATKSWDSQADQMSKAADHPLEALAGSLMMGVMSAASDQAVDRFAEAHCSLTVFGFANNTNTTGAATPAPVATDSPTVSDSPTRPAPPGMVSYAGTAPSSFTDVAGLIAFDGAAAGGQTSDTPQGANGLSFTILDARTFAVVRVGQTADSSCGWALGAGPDNQGIVLTQSFDTTPAAGLVPEKHTVIVHASNPSTGAELWHVTVPGQPTDQGPTCTVSPGGEWGGPGWVTFTSDGRYATDGLGVYDLKAGTVRAAAGLDAVGHWLVHQPADPNDLSQPWPVLDPATGAQVGSLPHQPMGADWPLFPAQSSAAQTWSVAGTVVAAGTYQDNNDDTHLAAYALPSGARVWDTDLGAGFQISSSNTFAGLDEHSGTLVVGKTALDDRTGKILWRHESDQVSQVCGADGGSVYALGATLTTLDARTGKQTSFDQRTSCPSGVRDGAVEMDPVDGGLQFSQITPGVLPSDASSTGASTDTPSPSGT